MIDSTNFVWEMFFEQGADKENIVGMVTIRKMDKSDGDK